MARGQRFLLLAASIGLCLNVEAGLFRSSTNRVEVLIITGNYAKSRLLAELAQHETRQPIVLVSPNAQGGDELYFMPCGEDAMAVEEAKLSEFIDFLKPKLIVFLGDETYLPPKYLQMLRERYPVLGVSSDDWARNAEALATVLKSSHLPGLFAQFLAQLQMPSVAPLQGPGTPAVGQLPVSAEAPPIPPPAQSAPK